MSQGTLSVALYDTVLRPLIQGKTPLRYKAFFAGKKTDVLLKLCRLQRKFFLSDNTNITKLLLCNGDLEEHRPH